MTTFAAIDFETADGGRDSACAVGIVRVERGRVAERISRLIRPPRRDFWFTGIHGITWEMVEREPRFREVWADVRRVVDGVDFLAAHNAPFDRSVLQACCRAARVAAPKTPFVCTVGLARHELGMRPADLASVCRRLRIPLRHHDALSDAEGCAGVVLAAAREGWRPE